VIDDQAQPMTDAPAILEGLSSATAALLPLGGVGDQFAGYKGYGLATMVEILSAALSGGVFMRDLLGFAEDGTPQPYRVGHFFLALDIEHILPLDVFKRVAGNILRELQNSRKAPGHERIYVAGEKEHEMIKQRQEKGIPVNLNLRRNLQTMRDELGIKGYEAYF
jgi:LDH2 family malate/lactate/ureidoglycolate dehydrogenase